MLLAVVASHPVRYYGALFCELARRKVLTVYVRVEVASFD